MTVMTKPPVPVKRAADRIDAVLDEIERYLAQIRAEASRLRGDRDDRER